MHSKSYYEEFYKDRDWSNQYIKVKYQVQSYLNVVNLTSTVQVKKVLDIGCGTGIYTKIFNDLGYDCRGIDFANSAIEKAKTQFPDCDFLQHDATNIQIQDKFDMLFVSGFSPFNTTNFEATQQIINRWSSCLEDEGVIFILGRTDFSGMESSSGWFYHTHDQIKTMFAHPDFSMKTYFAYPLFRYLVLTPLLKKPIMSLVSYISENFIGKIIRKPVRVMTVLVKEL
ncbi:class I SAM-dependent methyltransferase [Gracilimonas sp.]|uniref:class I SAM-dependent methyltransferase n=1 Tax=Gracilimonas sp. TaxID=1974203 RepID=UPI0032EF979D